MLQHGIRRERKKGKKWRRAGGGKVFFSFDEKKYGKKTFLPHLLGIEGRPKREEKRQKE